MAFRTKRYSRSARPNRIAAALAFGFFVAACTSTGDVAMPIESPGEAVSAEPVETSSTVDDVDVGTSQIVEVQPPASDLDSAEIVASRLESMTQEEKIGQLLMPVLAGTEANTTTADDAAKNKLAHGYDTPAEIVRNFKVGGVIYLQDNVSSAEQLRSFSRELQMVADEEGSSGLLIAIDQEGGRISRVSDGVTKFGSPQELSGDAARVNEAAFITGQQLKDQGINVVLAPVAGVLPEDGVGYLGDRSYGNKPQVVASMVEASVSGLQQSGVAAAVKHWPGHGPTTTDSHESLPVLAMSKQEWVARDRIPFEAAIGQDVAIVLVGHLALPQLDPSGDPATISEVIVQQLLKDELGFDGVVMTDALNMGGAKGRSEGDLMVASVVAGADILLIPPNLTATVEALNAAAVDGRISQSRLDDAVTRVLKLKLKLGLIQ